MKSTDLSQHQNGPNNNMSKNSPIQKRASQQGILQKGSALPSTQEHIACYLAIHQSVYTIHTTRYTQAAISQHGCQTALKYDSNLEYVDETKDQDTPTKIQKKTHIKNLIGSVRKTKMSTSVIRGTKSDVYIPRIPSSCSVANGYIHNLYSTVSTGADELWTILQLPFYKRSLGAYKYQTYQRK
jgi:DNA-binding beta-propeller fold protein YncE